MQTVQIFLNIYNNYVFCMYIAILKNDSFNLIFPLLVEIINWREKI